MIFCNQDAIYIVKPIDMETKVKQQEKNQEVIRINEAQVVAAIATAVKKVLANEKFRKHHFGERKE